VLQNCVIFNDKVHDSYTNRETRDETTVRLEAGKPMIFGKDKDKCLIQKGFEFQIAKVEEVDAKDIVVHDPANPYLVELLSIIKGPELPLPLGVIKKVDTPTYEE